MIEAFIKRIKKNKRLNRIKNRFPMLALNGVIKPLGRFRFKYETKLYEGQDVKTMSDQSSILFFTVHKCASTLVVKIIKEFSLKKRIIPVDLDSYIITFKNNDKSVFEDSSFQNKVFRDKGFYYGAMRYFRTIPKMEKYKTFLMLRDPRDVITSMYFSLAYSHTVFNEELLIKRDEVQNKTIDEFVLESIPKFKSRYNNYINGVLNKENTLFLKYEEMVSDFPEWLIKMTKWLDIYDVELVEKFTKEISFSPRKEDKHSHIRNIQPGDHLNKLKQSTIDILNKELHEVLIALEYIKN